MLLAPRPRCPGSTTAIGTSRYAIPTISAMPRVAIEIQALKSDSFGRISLMRDAGGVFLRRDLRHVTWWLWPPAWWPGPPVARGLRAAEGLSGEQACSDKWFQKGYVLVLVGL